jgi:hypothetical protein
VCKAFRLMSDNDGKFRDLITFGQHLYELEWDGLRIHFPNGYNRLFPHGMIGKWNWVDHMINTVDFAKKMSTSLQGDLQSFIVPTEVETKSGNRSKYQHEHADLFFRKFYRQIKNK